MTEDLACVLITGTVGAGKTTTAYAIGDLLRAAEVPHAVIDLDELRRGWPAPQGDPFNSALEIANLRSVAANYQRAGARRLVLAGVVEGPGARDRYADALGMPLTICRLVLGLPQVHTRLRGRHEPGTIRDWYLDRSGALDAVLDREAVADITLRVDDESPARVAALVLAGIGWSQRPPENEAPRPLVHRRDR